MSQRTPLYEAHLQAQAKMVDFGGWDMPIHYGSQLEEHKAVREDAGMFDVSHMTVVEVKGRQAKDYLRYLLANDVAKLKTEGKALYSCMLNEKGGVVDDLIVYFFNDEAYRLVVNAATREKDLQWLRQHASDFDVEIIERKDTAMIAIQGPHAREKTHLALNDDLTQELSDLKPFSSYHKDNWLIARTGYTGEDGYEITLPAHKATDFWARLLKAGVRPCGLGARDTLRLEAGLNLYGSDMDENVSPLAANLAWTVAFEPEDRNFMGKSALISQKKAGVTQKLVGLVLKDKGMLRDHLPVFINEEQVGEITSGSFSPTLGKAIALARILETDAKTCVVKVRNKELHANIVKPCFVRNGQVKIAL